MNNKKVNSYLSKYGFKNSCIHYQLESSELDAICVEKKLGVHSDSGALVVNTGEFTGRSPKDRYIVKDLITKNKVCITWDNYNILQIVIIRDPKNQLKIILIGLEKK